MFTVLGMGAEEDGQLQVPPLQGADDEHYLVILSFFFFSENKCLKSCSQARLSVEKLDEHFPACSGKIREVMLLILSSF